MTLAPPSPAAPRLLDARHRTTTAALLALVTMFAFEAVAVSLAMPVVARSLHGETLYPVAVVGMLTAAVVGMVLGGAWGDARGATTPVVVGSAGFAAGLLVSGLAGSMELVVAGRLLQGLGCGAALTGMYVAVADGYPAALRTRVFAAFATAWVLPSIVGPFVAGALVDLAGWRWVFLVVAAFSVASTLVVAGPVARRLPRRDLPVRPGRRLGHAVLAAVAVVCLHLAGHGGGPAVGVLLLVGVALLAVSLPVLLPTGTLRGRPGLPAVVAARGALGAAFACVEMFVPLVLQRESGLSPTLAGLVMMVGALGWTAGSAWSGRVADPATTPRLLGLGAALVATGAAGSLALVPVAHQAWLAAAVATGAFLVMALGMGVATPLLSTLALDLAEPGREGESGSAIQMSDALGQSVAAGLVGAVFARWFVLDQGTSYLSGFGLALALGLVAAVVARGCAGPASGG